VACVGLGRVVHVEDGEGGGGHGGGRGAREMREADAEEEWWWLASGKGEGMRRRSGGGGAFRKSSATWAYLQHLRFVFAGGRARYPRCFWAQIAGGKARPNWDPAPLYRQHLRAELAGGNGRTPGVILSISPAVGLGPPGRHYRRHLQIVFASGKECGYKPFPSSVDDTSPNLCLHKTWLTEYSGAFQHSHTMEECLFAN
jgi:hypothetical protein